MSEMRIHDHDFARLARVTKKEPSPHEISEEELAMLKGAGNVNALASGGLFPSKRESTSAKDLKKFGSDRIKNPEKKRAETVAQTILGRSKKS